MPLKNQISRKDFIKNCSVTMGLMSLGIGNLISPEKTLDGKEPEDESSAVEPADVPGIPAGIMRRGSWVTDLRGGDAGNIELVTGPKKCVIIINRSEHSAVQQAALFLASDIEKITGYLPPIVEKAGSGNSEIHLATLGSGDIPELLQQQLNGKHEAYCVKTGNHQVWLAGSDFRGTAFAAYTLSERLGIDPLYHWTGYQPVKHPQLTLKAIDFYSPPPVFKYRGFFNDDEDVLPRPFEKAGYPLRIGDISLTWYQRYFETALRLGMNMAAPFCRVHRRYEVQKCASDWGLYYTSHHYDILLSNPFGIERFRLAEKRGVTTDWDWFKSKDNMMKYWRGGVEENKEINAIWPVGLRGTDDHAYEFPDGTPANVQADVFSEAISTQVKTVKSLAKNYAAPLFHFTMYTEMLEKYKQQPGNFNLPEEVIIVWPDNDDGVMRSLPTDKGKWRHGVYYHLAYFGKNISKQGPHVISPNRIAEEFKKIRAAGATEFLLVNVSEMREHVMEMRMIAELCHDDSLFQQTDTGKNYTQWWVNEYFGATGLSSTKEAYHQYYQLLNTADKVWFGTELVQEMADKLFKKINGQAFTPPDGDKAALLKTRLSQYRSAMLTIDAAKKTMSREQKQFFFENVTLGLLIDYCPSQAAALLLKALDAGNEKERWQHIEEAIIPLQQLETALWSAERPPFEKWYGETWIKNETSPLNYHRAYKQVRELISTGGRSQPVKTRVAIGHNIAGAQLWNDYMEEADKINPAY